MLIRNRRRKRKEEENLQDVADENLTPHGSAKPDAIEWKNELHGESRMVEDEKNTMTTGKNKTKFAELA